MSGFSKKQRRVLRWWTPSSPDCGFDAIICDGAVRSGKTLSTGLGFFCWAMCCFEGKKFALCGKTAASVRRNLISEVLPMLQQMGFTYNEVRSRGLFTVRLGRRENTFYLFGGKDEGAAAHVQGITLAGALLDEVALMPRSFVEQVCARCSVEGSRIWFSCNPESPGHWFFKEWIQNAERKNALYLTFTMEDNPGLSSRVRRRYETIFQGVFYRRFVLGEWVAAEGLVYDFFDESYIQPLPEGEMEAWYISCDYGTVNPTSMGLWGKQKGVWYRVAEYYYDSRLHRAQKTDGEYVGELKKLAGGRQLQGVIVDPSAASFMEALRREGMPVRKADNDVLAGIRVTAQLLKSRQLVICSNCPDAIREFGLYRWQQRDAGRDMVWKEHDHAMDEIRYFAATVAPGRGKAPFFAGSVERNRF